jgi:3-hydroxyisobutyrate dehydrogenase-like beta-hydroxyacid dehydrogenase
MGQRTFYVGQQPHVANVVKLSGNFLMMAMLESLGEAMALVRKHGVDPGEYLEVMTSAVFPAPVYKNYGGLIARQEFEPAGFRLILGLKDVRLILGAAESAAVPMPIASLVHDQFVSAMARGLAEQDWSAISRVAAENAGLK